MQKPCAPIFLVVSRWLPGKGCAAEQALKRLDQERLKDAVKQGLVYFEREERDLHMLLFPEVLDQVTKGNRARVCTVVGCSLVYRWCQR